MNRRTLLTRLGLIAALGSLAGCTEFEGDGAAAANENIDSVGTQDTSTGPPTNSN